MTTQGRWWSRARRARLAGVVAFLGLVAPEHEALADAADPEPEARAQAEAEPEDLASFPRGAESPTAASEDAMPPSPWTGRTLGEIDLRLPEGELDRELQYLVEPRVGEPYDPQAVARTLALFYRLDRFDGVEAWVGERSDGSLLLQFRLSPRPRIAGVRFEGVGPAERAGVRAAMSRGRGDPYAPGDEERIALDATRWYRDEGWREVRVRARVERPRGGGRRVVLHVTPGVRDRIAEVRFPTGDLAAFGDRATQSFLPAELKPGRPYRERDLAPAVERVLKRFRQRGHVQARLLAGAAADGAARVPIPVERIASGRVRIRLPIDPGPLGEVEFEWTGKAPPNFGRAALLDTIGWSSAGSLSTAFAEDAAERLVRRLQTQGYLDATVQWTLEDDVSPRVEARTAAWKRPLAARARRLGFRLDAGPLVRLYERDVQVDGNRFATDREIRRVLWDASPTVLGHRDRLWSLLGFDIYRHFFTEAEMSAAASVLTDWYRARGFLAATVNWTHTVRESARAGARPSVHLSLRIEEGARTYVDALVIEGLPAGEEGALPPWRRSVEGAPYNPAVLDELSGTVREYLGNRGHADVIVTAQTEPGTTADRVRVVLRLERVGTRRFGTVLVRGNRTTQSSFIRREVEGGGVASGRTFHLSALAGAQERLLRTGLFEGIELQTIDAGGPLRDVEVVVRERDRFHFALGGGISWPDDGPRLSGEARLRNLDGRGLSLWARGRFGIDWAYIFQPELIPQPDYRASVGLDFPHLPGAGLQGALTAILHEQIDESTYRIDRSSIALGLAWRRLPNLDIDARVELQQRAPVRVDPAVRLHPEADQPVTRFWKDADTLVLFGLNLAFDLRDDRFNPRRGLFFSFAADSTPGALLAEAPAFGRAQGRLVGWIPFGDVDAGLQLEGAAGVAWSYDGSLPPVEWRFRLGGTSTVRGYALDALGANGERPGVLAEESLLSAGHPARSVPVGGNAFYRYSAQLQLPLPGLRAFRLVLFHDAGNTVLYGDLPSGVRSSLDTPLWWSVGLGLRRTTPIGPLRIDLGLRPDRIADLARGAAVLGDVVRVHFAVGAL